MTDRAPIRRVHPLEETLGGWADHLLPELDVWYWGDGGADLDRADCVVLPRADYLQHPTFQDIRYVNAYLHWQMPPEVTQVIVSGPAWIASLDEADRHRVLGKQVALKRGLVFPRSFFEELPCGLDAYAIDDQVVLSHAAWALVPDEARRLALLREQSRWDDVDCFEIPDEAPEHIRAIANAFGETEGANCLATTACCVTGEAWMRDVWMFQPAFRNLIARHGYRPVPDTSAMTDDVVTFESDGEIVHAAYCVEADRFLSKNGQSRFNPTRIVDWTMLSTDWPDTTLVMYRRKLAHDGDARCT